MTLLECCLSDVSSDGLAALKNSEYDLNEKICLDRCGVCYDRPFLIVDGELHTGDSHKEILNSLESNSQEQEE
jgi:uncharacterized protein YuzB (UPF0349 family)